MQNKLLNRRVAIVGTRGIPASYGGYETFAENISIRLVEKSYKVTVYCEGKQKYMDYQGVDLVYFPSLKLGAWSTLVYDFVCIIHATFTSKIILVLGCGPSPFCIIPRIFSKVVLISTDGIEWKRKKFSFFARLYLYICEGLSTFVSNEVISDAKAIDDYLHSKYKHSFKSKILEYGAYVQDPPTVCYIKKYQLEPRSYNLIVCRLEPENNILEILTGYCLSKCMMPLIVLGNISNPNAYVKKLLEFSKDKRIRFIGTVYDKDKLYELRSYANVYFHGHTVGGTNPSLLEGMAAGNIIVAHENVFNREVLNDIGYFFKEPKDIVRLLDYEHIQEDNNESQIRRKASKDRVADYYNWDRIVMKYLELFDAYL